MRDEKLFYVYIMADRSRVLYIGVTSDLYQRVHQHRKGVFKGFTSRYACNRLVWFERFTGPNEAIAREKQIKRWRREKKVFLIEEENQHGRIWQQIGSYRFGFIPQNERRSTGTPVEKRISPLCAARSGRNDKS